MARLEWNNVAAPDFSSAQAGMEAFSRMLDRATQSAATTIKDYDNRGLKREQDILAQRLLGYSDAKELQAANAAGTPFAGLSRLGAADFERADNRFGTLLSRKGAELDITQKEGVIGDQKYARDNLLERDQAREAAAPVVQLIRNAYRSGDLEGAKRLQEDNAEALAPLKWDDFRNFQSDIQGDASSWRTGRGQDQTYDQNNINFQETQAERQRAKDVAAAVVAIRDAGGSDIDLERSSGYQALDAMGKQAARAALGVTGDGYAPVGVLPGETPSGPVTADAMYAITAQSESGNRERDAKGNLITSSAGAQGRMQVMPTTNLNPGYGVRPAQNNSDAERTRVGRDYLAAMLKKYGNDPAKAWAAYNWGPGHLDNAIKEHGPNWLRTAPQETKDYVAKNMAALGVPATGPTTNRVTAETTTARGTDRFDGFTQRIVPALDNKDNITTVVQRYGTGNFALATVDARRREALITEVINMAARAGMGVLKPEAAAVIAEDSIRQAKLGDVPAMATGRAASLTGITNPLGGARNGRLIDYNLVRDYLEQIKTNPQANGTSTIGLSSNLQLAQNRNDRQASAAELATQIEARRADLAVRRARYGDNDTTMRLQQDIDRLSQRHQALLAN